MNVEAVIMEISASKNDSTGVSLYGFKANSSGEAIGRVGFGGGNIANLFDVTSTGGIISFGSGDDVKVNVGSGTQTIKTITGLVTLLKNVTDVNILSTPHITAMDNVEATIEVGENVPVSSSTTQNGTSSVTNITREPVTIKLQIKPRISPGSDAVQLEIQQTVKQLSSRVVKAENLANNAVSTTERAVKTNITVNDGDTAVLGGLIRETEDVKINKVPLLGDIPILGWLFKSKSVDKEKANLVMFITPKILRTSKDARDLVHSRMEERIDFIKKNMGGKDPFGKAAMKTIGDRMEFQEVQPAENERIEEIEPDLDSGDDFELDGAEEFELIEE